MNNTTRIIAICALATVATAGVATWFYRSESDDIQKPGTTYESKFLLNESGYECSRPIEGKWEAATVGQLGEAGKYFQPSNPEDLEKYCRMTYIIEYHSVLQILQMPDVAADIERFSTVQAWVRALSHDYIDDKSYLKRILPDRDVEYVDCIIVVHTPERTRFFIENGVVHNTHADHRYEEVSAESFLSSLNAASDEDVTNFWLGLH